MPATNKAPNTWTDADFLAWATDKLQVQSPLTDEQVAQQVFQTKQIKEGSVQEAKALIKTDASSTKEAVEKTPSTPPQATEKTDPTPSGNAKPAAAQKRSQPAQVSKQHLAQSSSTAKIVIDNLDQYVKAMAPGVAHHNNEGASQQTRLFRTIQTILRQDGSDFHALFNTLLNTVNEHRQGVFHERYAFRYFDQLNLTNRERRNFERMLSLMLDTADPKLRTKAAQRVDIGEVMEGFGDNEAQQRVVSFYTQL
jgi:hypothetical protein